MNDAYANNIEFRNAEGRLRLMEEWAKGRLSAKAPMAVIRRPEPTPPPVLLPSRWRGVLYGSDGKRMEE